MDSAGIFCSILGLEEPLRAAPFLQTSALRFFRRVCSPPHEAAAATAAAIAIAIAIGLGRRGMICRSPLVEKPNNDFEQPVQMIDLPPPPPPPLPLPPFLTVKALIYGVRADDGGPRYPV